MKYTAIFYPEKRKGIEKNVPVILSVYFGGNRMLYTTGKRCDIAQWDTGKDKNDPTNLNRLRRNQVVKSGETSTEFNAELTRIEAALGELFKSYDVQKVVPTPTQLRDALKLKLGKTPKKAATHTTGFFDRYEKFVADSTFSATRAAKHKQVLNVLQSWKPSLKFSDLDTQFLTDLNKHLIETRNLAQNTTITHLKCLKAFLNHANRHEWTSSRPFDLFTIGTETYGDPVTLTIEERDLLYDAKIENESLARIRDMFVFQCLIGCRVGDFRKLKKTNIIDGSIEYIAGKTKDHKPRVVRVPLTEKAKTILSRYDLPNGDLFPYISDQRYNEYIRDVFALVKLTRMVTVPDPKTRANIQKPLNELASSHMARRTFINSLYGKGVKNEIIGSMSGHADGSKAFSRYYNINVKDQQAAVNLIE
ncbi:MAG: site-specific integrase [Mangrovibacterium sp.]